MSRTISSCTKIATWNYELAPRSRCEDGVAADGDSRWVLLGPSIYVPSEPYNPRPWDRYNPTMPPDVGGGSNSYPYSGSGTGTGNGSEAASYTGDYWQCHWQQRRRRHGHGGRPPAFLLRPLLLRSGFRTLFAPWYCARSLPKCTQHTNCSVRGH